MTFLSDLVGAGSRAGSLSNLKSTRRCPCDWAAKWLAVLALQEEMLTFPCLRRYTYVFLNCRFSFLISLLNLFTFRSCFRRLALLNFLLIF